MKCQRHASLWAGTRPAPTSMSNEQTQKLAERIALLLQQSEREADAFSALQASIEKLHERLDKIESQIASPVNSSVNSTFQTIPAYKHASQDRFAIEEAITDEINRFFGTEKACTFEPNGKPCDHCAMCSSRGF